VHARKTEDLRQEEYEFWRLQQPDLLILLRSSLQHPQWNLTDMGRYDRLRQIERLDPKRDHVEIYHLNWLWAESQ